MRNPIIGNFRNSLACRINPRSIWQYWLNAPMTAQFVRRFLSILGLRNKSAATMRAKSVRAQILARVQQQVILRIQLVNEQIFLNRTTGAASVESLWGRSSSRHATRLCPSISYMHSAHDRAPKNGVVTRKNHNVRDSRASRENAQLHCGGV